MTYEALKRGGSLIICLLFMSCGIKKKTQTKTVTTTQHTITNLVQNKVQINDSTLTYLNIETLKIVSKDSTQPIRITDSKGNTTTFYNVTSLTTTKDKSVVRNAINKSTTTTKTSTVGSTTTVDKEVKTKFKLDTTAIYIVVGLILLLLVGRILRKFTIF